jgi:hypothetical protein
MKDVLTFFIIYQFYGIVIRFQMKLENFGIMNGLRSRLHAKAYKDLDIQFFTR